MNVLKLGPGLRVIRYDEKLVGPPYNTVLPKYADNPEAMVSYILKPVKVDENYPPMPAQPLKPQQAQAVVKYQLENMNKQ